MSKNITLLWKSTARKAPRPLKVSALRTPVKPVLRRPVKPINELRSNDIH
ncbi:MAG TPA: hypothetical protein VF268_01710 [Gammaproteobacteria bacterium]